MEETAVGDVVWAGAMDPGATAGGLGDRLFAAGRIRATRCGRVCRSRGRLVAEAGAPGAGLEPDWALPGAGSWRGPASASRRQASGGLVAEAGAAGGWRGAGGGACGG